MEDGVTGTFTMFFAQQTGVFWGLLLSFLSIATASPLSRRNATITGPGVSPEAFKRAVSAPYVFTAFTSVSESNLYVYTSTDATTFALLKGPAYTPPTGLIRDPSVILHSEYVDWLYPYSQRSCLALLVANIILHVCETSFPLG